MEDNLKFLILFFYYERPKIARAALESIQSLNYSSKRCKVAFIDDSEDSTAGKALFDEFLLPVCGDTYFFTNDTLQKKLERGGSNFGATANMAIDVIGDDCDVVIPLCDDDRVYPSYLLGLNTFYKANPQVMYSYCDVIVHNPLVEDWKDKLNEPASDHFLNHNHNPHCGGNSKDSSQISIRRECFTEGGVRWKAPLTACLDYYMWLDLNNIYGPAVFNGTIGQIKSYWPKSLGGRGDTYGNTE